MIVYDKLWTAMKEKGISQNHLYKYYNVSRAQIYRLKHNEVVYTSTLNMLCNILGCDDISDIATFVPDHPETRDTGNRRREKNRIVRLYKKRKRKVFALHLKSLKTFLFLFYLLFFLIFTLPALS